MKMLYRSRPVHPPKLLLRIVSAAGAGVLLGAAACSSSSGGGAPIGLDGGIDSGSPETPADGSAEGAVLVCGKGGLCGSIAMLPDAEGAADVGAAGDGPLTCGHGGVCGVMIMPDDASVVHGVVINPGH